MSSDSTQQMGLQSRYRMRIRVGLLAAVALAVFTIVEYIVAVSVDAPTLWLVPFMLLKGYAILEFFMHFSNLTNGEDH